MSALTGNAFLHFPARSSSTLAFMYPLRWVEDYVLLGSFYYSLGYHSEAHVVEMQAPDSIKSMDLNYSYCVRLS